MWLNKNYFPPFLNIVYVIIGNSCISDLRYLRFFRRVRVLVNQALFPSNWFKYKNIFNTNMNMIIQVIYTNIPWGITNTGIINCTLITNVWTMNIIINNCQSLINILLKYSLTRTFFITLLFKISRYCWKAKSFWKKCWVRGYHTAYLLHICIMQKVGY